MARINLLPWREELRKQYLKEFLMGIGVAVVITLIGLISVHLYITDKQNYQNRRNKILGDQIAKIDLKIREIKDIETKKNQMLGKIEVIYKLQKSRPQIVHLFEELTKTTPEGVYLTGFQQSGSAISMQGKSQSNARVSAFMRAIEASKWLTSPKLSLIKLNNKQSSSEPGAQGHTDTFTLKAKQDEPKPKDNKPQVN